MMKVSRINQLNLMPFTSALGFFSESFVESRGFVVSPFRHDRVIRGLAVVVAGIKMMGLYEALQRSRLGLRYVH